MSAEAWRISDVRRVIWYVVVSGLTVAALGLVIWDVFVRDLPYTEERGELIAESVSPNGRWTVRAYYVDPGAAASAGVRAWLLDEGGRAAQVYLELGVGEARIEWIGDSAVLINAKRVRLANPERKRGSASPR